MLTPPIIIRSATTEKEWQGILDLQHRNLSENLAAEEIHREGFVTVHHTLDDLREMSRFEKSIMAVVQQQVVGYVLAMTMQARQHIPILQPLFEMLDHITYKGKPVSNYPYIMVGQVCVDKSMRGSGVLQSMYAGFRDAFSSRYDFALTEIASRNGRSMAAHEKVGFKTIHIYSSSDGEEWQIVVWDWRDRIQVIR